MSDLSDLIQVGLEASGKIARLASAVQSLEDFGLSSEQRVEFEVLLRQGLSDVADRISEVLNVGVDTATPGATGGTPRGERVVESLVDVHNSSSRVPTGVLVTPESSTGTLGDAADSVSSRDRSAALSLPTGIPPALVGVPAYGGAPGRESEHSASRTTNERLPG